MRGRWRASRCRRGIGCFWPPSPMTRRSRFPLPVSPQVGFHAEPNFRRFRRYVCSCCGLPVCPPPCPTGGTGVLTARGGFSIPVSGGRVPRIPKGCERGAKLRIAPVACPPARAAASLSALCPPNRPDTRHSMLRDYRRRRLRHRFAVNRDRIRYFGASHATSRVGVLDQRAFTSVKWVSNQCNGRLY